MGNLSFWDLFEVVGLIFTITGKLVFADHITTEDWMKLMADPRFVELLKRIFGE